MQIHKAQLEELVPLWHDLALRFHKDAAALKAFGWIQEASPCALAHVRPGEGQDQTHQPRLMDGRCCEE